MLLSALRKYKSKSALLETPEAFFDEGEERNAFYWLRDYVATHNAWPSAGTFERHTGVTNTLTQEPLTYYLDDARKRALWQSLFDPFAEFKRCMENKDPDGAVAIMRHCQQLAGALNHRQEGLTTFAQSMRMLELDYETAKQTRGDLRGIPTGWEFTDDVTDGYQNSDLITVVGRSGRGKTQILLKKAFAAREAGRSVLFLSMEMGVLQLARRYYGLRTRVNPRFLRRAELSTYAEREFLRNLNVMSEEETPLHWLAGNFKKTVPALKAAAYECEPDIIFADASYLLKPEIKNQKFGQRRELIADVMEQLTGMAKEFDRPIVQSVQFNRTAVKPKRGDEEGEGHNPISHMSLEKIGETDTIGQNSSIVYGLDYGDVPNEKHERYLGILKGREGEEGWMKINYRFQPVDMSEITNSRDNQFSTRVQSDVNLGFMDADV